MVSVYIAFGGCPRGIWNLSYQSVNITLNASGKYFDELKLLSLGWYPVLRFFGLSGLFPKGKLGNSGSRLLTRRIVLAATGHFQM